MNGIDEYKIEIDNNLADIKQYFEDMYNEMDEVNLENHDLEGWIDWNKNDYQNFSNLENSLILLYTSDTGIFLLEDKLIKYSNDILLWADHTNQYICIALKAYERIIDTYIYFSKKNGSSLDILSNDIIHYKSDVFELKSKIHEIIEIEKNNNDDGYNTDDDGNDIRLQAVELYEALQLKLDDTMIQIDKYINIFTDCLSIIDRFQKNLKIFSTVGIAINITNEAWNIQEKLNNLPYTIIDDDPIITTDENEIDEIDSLSDNELFPKNNSKFWKEYLITEQRNNSIIYFNLVKDTYSYNNKLYYKIIEEEIEEDSFEDLELNDANFLPTVKNINDEFNLKFPEIILNLFKAISFINNIPLTDSYIEDIYNNSSKSITLEEFKISFLNIIDNLKNDYTYDLIKDIIQKLKIKKNNIGIQYLLKTNYMEETNLYLISEEELKLDFNMVLGIYQNKTDIVFQDIQYYLNDIYLNKLNNESNLIFYEDYFVNFQNIKLDFNDYLKPKHKSIYTSKKIVIYKEDKLYKEFPNILCSASYIENDFKILYGIFEIIQNSKQYKVVYDNSFYRTINLHESVDEQDPKETIIKMSETRGHIQVKQKNIYTDLDLDLGNLNIKNYQYKLLNYNYNDKRLRKNFLTETTEVTTEDIYTNYRSFYEDNELKTKIDIFKRVEYKKRITNYIYKNAEVRVATNAANLFRYRIKHNKIPVSEGINRAILLTLEAFGIRKNFQNFIDNTYDINIPEENYQRDQIIDIEYNI